MRRGGLVVSTLDYGSWGRELKSYLGQELLTSKWPHLSRLSSKWVHWLFSWWKSKSARERTGHPPSLNRGVWNFGLLTARAPYYLLTCTYLYFYYILKYLCTLDTNSNIYCETLCFIVHYNYIGSIFDDKPSSLHSAFVYELDRFNNMTSSLFILERHERIINTDDNLQLSRASE